MLLARSTAVRRPPPLPAPADPEGGAVDDVDDVDDDEITHHSPRVRVRLPHTPVKPRALAISPLAVIRRGAVLPSTTARPLAAPERQLRSVPSPSASRAAPSGEASGKLAADSPTGPRQLDVARSPRARMESSTNRRAVARRARPVALMLAMLIFIGYLVVEAMLAVRWVFLRARGLGSVARARLRTYWDLAAEDAGWR